MSAWSIGRDSGRKRNNMGKQLTGDSKLLQHDADDNVAERGVAKSWGMIRFVLWVWGLFCLICVILAVAGIAAILPG